jgi:hypothetical protein
MLIGIEESSRWYWLCAIGIGMTERMEFGWVKCREGKGGDVPPIISATVG